ncbi:MAG: hypothetical protein IKD88_06710 [Lachnospiraceae bacterium]|nr:hypothetical protein [Lachnospiraceae bacterium]
MYQKSPITDRIARIRKRYRTTRPTIDLNRYKLVTEFYMNNPQLFGIIKRAKNLKNLFENMPTPIFEDELIVGFPGETYRCTALQPEVGLGWLMAEIDTISTRTSDPYDISEETKAYIRETISFWDKNYYGASVDEHMPRFFLENHAGNGVNSWNKMRNSSGPIGHFCGDFTKVVDKGFGAIRDEALAKMQQLEINGIYGDSNRKYMFYYAVSLVSEGIITYVKRYAAEAARQAAECTDPTRKAELEQMADSLNWIIEKPCRNFWEAMQAVYFYQLGHILDGQLHGITFGRVDQYVGKYLEADLAAGKITEEFAQEITDSFILKIAENNKVGPEVIARNIPGYTSGQMMTVGGLLKDGSDATNKATYMILQSSHRLILHDPPVSLRVHAGTPDDLWEAAIECTKAVGGVPIFENDDVAIKGLLTRGIPIEDARNYCLIGCVEPAVCGNDFACSGADGSGTAYTVLPTVLWHTMNNGVNPFHFPGTPEPVQTGLALGHLYDYQTMQELLDAYKEQLNFFLKLHVNNVNCWEYVYSNVNPLPFLSATMGGCMESGLDVMWGGATYNGTGNSSIGHGTVVDSLNIIDQLCFREKYCTTRELYDALMANWEGYEELRQYILGKAKHFGNNDPEADKYVAFVGNTYSEGITSKGITPRNGQWTAGSWPVTMNVTYGKMVAATPDGRKASEPLSDGISPVQSMDKSGPFATINSITKFDQSMYRNGTLCNMKFHPTALQGAEGDMKLRSVMETYFDKGGMELQINVVSAETMRDAQEHPENYQDLVVRIAGFSAYFVEVYKEAQDDLIRRTEMSV